MKQRLHILKKFSIFAPMRYLLYIEELGGFINIAQVREIGRDDVTLTITFYFMDGSTKGVTFATLDALNAFWEQLKYLAI